MVDEKNRNDVHKWVEDYFEKKSGTGIGPVYGGRIKMHLSDQKVTSVNDAKKYIQGRMAEGTFLNPTIHNAFQRHFEGEARPQAKATQAREQEAKVAEREAKARKEAEEEEIQTDKAAQKEAKARAKAEKAERRADEAGGKGVLQRPYMGGSQGRYGGFVDISNFDPRNWSRQGRSDNTLAIIAFLWTLALAIVDYAWLGFGGLDYNKLLEILSAVGIKLLLISLLPIFTLAGLAVKMLLEVSAQHKTIKWFIVTIPLLVIANFLTNTYGNLIVVYSFSIFTTIAILISMVWGYMFLEPERQEVFRSWVFIAVVSSFIFSYAVLTDPRTILHLATAVLVWLYFFSETGKTSKANNRVASLMIVDWIGWSLFRLVLSVPDSVPTYVLFNRYIFPIWFLAVALYSFDRKDSKFIKVATTIVLIIYVFTLVDVTYGWVNIKAQAQVDTKEIEAAKSFGQQFIEKLKAFPGKIFEEYERGMEYATGGYYQGKVEENEDPRNELGVHIEELQAADKEFYENEQVVLWGDLKAKTLDKPIYVYMSCESDGIKGTIKPTTSYKIERFEEIPFECRFNGGELKAGTNNIEVKVEFNFETLGYLKTYFMDIERMRALRKENVDPLRQYGIDKKPEARYTNGPVKLGMGTVDPPVGLGTTVDGYSYIGVMVQPQWYGKIKNITDLTIQVPKDLEVEKIDDLYCRQEFEMVEEGSEGYSIYKMTKDAIKKIKTPIGDYKSWRCSIRIPIADVPAILGNTPVATYYYRANVSYIYEIEKSTSVYIKSVIGEQRILLDCKTVCDDSDGCVCTITGCCIPQGESIRIGYTCDNDPSPSNACRGYDRTISDIDYAIRYIDGLLAINELCARGLTDDAKRELDASNLNQSEKDSIRGLLEGCSSETTKINYIEFGEDKIVKKVQETVTMFQTTKNTLLQLTDENKRTLNSKKEEFIGEIDEVIGKFGQIKTVYNLNIQDTQRLTILEGEKVKLQGWAY